jgi:hypothetical protein
MAWKEKAQAKLDGWSDRTRDKSEPGCQFERERIDQTEPEPTRNQLAQEKSGGRLNHAVELQPNRVKGCIETGAG